MNDNNHMKAAPVHQLVGQLRELLAKSTPGPWMNNEFYELIHTHSDKVKLKPLVMYHIRNDNSVSDSALIVASINALPALLAIAEAAQLLAEKEGYPCEGSADYHRRFAGLRTALSLLPNAKADLAPASGAQVQRLVGPALGAK